MLDKAEGTGLLRASPQVGSTVPVHATAVGKLFLAFGDAPLVRTPLERFTDHTLASAVELERAVARARRDGTATSREEWMPGLSVLAAPIIVRDRMRGALALGAPTPRLRRADRGRAARARARRSGGRISARLSGTSHE